MKITRTQLRRIIKESIEGNVHGDPEKEAFLDIAMKAISRAQYKRAASAVMDSYMIDDVWPEEEQALVDMLANLPSGVSSREVEAIAGDWMDAFTAGALASNTAG